MAAGQRRPTSRLAERGAPHDVPGIRTQPVDEITLGCRDDQGGPGPWCSPIQRLRVDVSLDAPVEFLDAADCTHGLPIEVRDDVIARTVRCTMVERDCCVY